jgi:hypothetical protein
MNTKNIIHFCEEKTIEKIIFDNGISDYFFSEDIHKINLHCNRYGLNQNNQNIFNEVNNILKLQ